MAEIVVTQLKLWAADCEVRLECGVRSYRHGLRAGEDLTRIVLMPEAQALQVWCAVGTWCCCCVEAF